MLKHFTDGMLTLGYVKAESCLPIINGFSKYVAVYDGDKHVPNGKRFYSKDSMDDNIQLDMEFFDIFATYWNIKIHTYIVDSMTSSNLLKKSWHTIHNRVAKIDCVTCQREYSVWDRLLLMTCKAGMIITAFENHGISNYLGHISSHWNKWQWF